LLLVILQVILGCLIQTGFFLSSAEVIEHTTVRGQFRYISRHNVDNLHEFARDIAPDSTHFHRVERTRERPNADP
jgi:hypothetical protein